MERKKKKRKREGKWGHLSPLRKGEEKEVRGGLFQPLSATSFEEAAPPLRYRAVCFPNQTK